MAEKRSRLEIVLSAVDKATAGLRAVQQRINAIAILAAPVSLVGERLGGLAKEAGLPKLVEGFKGVGGALKDVLGKLTIVGGVAAGAVYGMMSLVNEFDDLGDRAERLGVSVDFLAQVGDAAKRTGSSAEMLGQGIHTFVAALGEARAGKGPLVEFLKVVSPALLRQLKAAKDNEEAFNLLADATAKLEDPAKRAALAQKTIGNAALAPLLARGSKGIQELRDRYAEFNPEVGKAVQASGAVGEAMDDLKAATDGVKAALVVGLAPALSQLVGELTAFFAENRERITEWAIALGRRLPAAIHKFVDSVLFAFDDAQEFIGAIGGIRTVAIALAAVIVGPLVASVYSLGVALLTTPVGWIVAGIAAIAAGAYLLITRWDAVKGFFVGLWDALGEKFGIARDIAAYILAPFIYIPVKIIANWGKIRDFFVSLWDGVTAAFQKAWDTISGIVDKVTGAVSTVTGAIGDALDAINPFSDSTPMVDYVPGSGGVLDMINRATDAAAANRRAAEARVTVDFANAPRGTRVAADPQSTAAVDLSVGYQMGLMP